MPNYKNTLIKTTTVPILELTDELQRRVINKMKLSKGIQFFAGSTQTTYDLTNLNLSAGNYAITAVAEAEGFTDSDASNSVNYSVQAQLATPTIAMNADGKTLEITDVENATSYDVYVDGTMKTNVASTPNTTTVDLSTLSDIADGVHTVTVKAKADGYRDSEVSNAVDYTVTTPSLTNYILFEGETSDFTLKATNKEWDGTVEYSTDKNTWSTWDGSEIPSANKKLYLRGKNNTTFYTSKGVRFVLSAKAGCYGNINTLLDYENPPTTLANNCYRDMFYSCTSLTTAPALPATTLANYCYNSMFSNCKSLTSAPELPATTLASNCYNSMFAGCTSLTTAPELPATTLASSCYQSMFQNCTSLTTAPALPATTLANNCYQSMFERCTLLTTAPALPATTLADNCYRNMFQDCISLNTAPALPATTDRKSTRLNSSHRL